MNPPQEFQTQGLDFVADDSRVGFRLQRLEVLNWGTFHQRVWRYEPQGHNGLLTGDIGSGKSTLVDAVTTLLVPAQRVAYNKAAGADARERSLRSYVLGYYKSERNDTTGTSRQVGLRDATSYSVILGVFRNESYDQDVTLAQVFWLRDPQGAPARLFVAAERALSIAADFSGFGSDIVGLRKQLRAGRCEVSDSFPPYGAWFRRRFGIEHEQALELFHQTVSMKSVGNLTDFVRSHMLEPFDVAGRIEALLTHFHDLDRAHQAVVKAKEQLALLAPLVEDGARYTTLAADIQTLRDGREALRPYFAGLKAELLTRRLALLSQDAAHTAMQIERLTGERDAARTAQTRIEQALRDNGGDRLEQLAADIRQRESQKAQCQAKAKTYAQLLAQIDAAPPADEAAFLAQQQAIAARKDTLQTQLAEQQNREQEDGYALRQGREEHTALSAEIDSLEQRKSNIDAAQIRIRAALCAALSITEDDLPFAGELIAVCADARDWEGAAERLLRGFGLSLLVPDQHYATVAGWVERQHLGVRLVYFHVRVRTSAPASTLHPQSLAHKLSIKPDTPHEAWLEQELQRRFDFACCDSIEQFHREARAITRAGQIKDPNGRHEKDDRSRLDDRAHYVLGWSNAEKLRTLKTERTRLEDHLAGIGARIAATQAERGQCEAQLQAVAKLEVFSHYHEIDWHSPAHAIATLSEEYERLKTASDTLRELEQQLSDAHARLRDVEDKLENAHSERGKIASKIEIAQAQHAQAQDICTQNPVDAQQNARLSAWCVEALGAVQLTVESCDNREHALREWLKDRIDAAEKRQKNVSERIIKAMSAFKQAFTTETAEIDVSLAALPEFERLMDGLQRDDLPRFEARFKELLNVNTINEIAHFNARLAHERDTIRARVERINQSLHAIDYNPGRYIRLLTQASPDAEIRDFQQDLRACTEGALSGAEDEQYSEAKFLQVKTIIDRLRGREGFADIDRRWVQKVTDVRQWFLFSASERWRADDAEHEHYTDSGGKSGGQKEKLAYTVLAASLAYQFGLEWGAVRSRSFRFVVIDEAFGRGSDESAQYGLELFRKLNLQLLIVTPLQKIHIIEPYVASVGFVHNEGGRDSQLRCLTIEEYRAEARARNAAP